jgi:hypothetical protein
MVAELAAQTNPAPSKGAGTRALRVGGEEEPGARAFKD